MDYYTIHIDAQGFPGVARVDLFDSGPAGEVAVATFPAATHEEAVERLGDHLHNKPLPVLLDWRRRAMATR